MVPSQAPLYIGGMVGYIVANLVCAVLLLLARHSMSKMNLKKEEYRNTAEYCHDNDKYDNVDVTDVEDVRFVYTL
jgi:ACS family allantoate permease-like MFS transporter